MTDRKEKPAGKVRQRHPAATLLDTAGRVARAGIVPMSMQEIDIEVKAVRRRGRLLLAGHRGCGAMDSRFRGNGS
jgi:hypothetical protein